VAGHNEVLRAEHAEEDEVALAHEAVGVLRKKQLLLNSNFHPVDKDDSHDDEVECLGADADAKISSKKKFGYLESSNARDE